MSGRQKKAYPAKGQNSPKEIHVIYKISKSIFADIIPLSKNFVNYFFVNTFLFPDTCYTVYGGDKMIYTEKTKKALCLCFDAHKDQRDKSGMPYVFHPFHLAEQMTTEETTVVALLHDLVEDTDYTIEDLTEMGFDKTITDAIALMTHADGVDYMEYVDAIKNNPIAKTVKLADLRHNSDLSRLDVVDQKALERREKYRKAIALLEK